MGSRSKPRFGDIIRWKIDGQVIMYVGDAADAHEGRFGNEYGLSLNAVDRDNPLGSVHRYGFDGLQLGLYDIIERKGDTN